MRISVIGCGYLGAVHAACMASLGHDVLGVDVDEGRISALQQHRPPFYEPGFDSLLTEAAATGRLRFTTEPDPEELAAVDVHFIAVGTPQGPTGAADLSYVESAVASLLPVLERRPGALVVGKSTVPVGTAAALAERIEAAGGLLLWNPEFLREGFAIEDTLRPDRIVYGVSPDPDKARESQRLLDEVYASLLADGIPRLVTDYATAELVKVAANSFLATKISFINAMAEVCEVTGGDVTALAEAIGHDVRIGNRFLQAGVGFGGGCLPKDIRAFMARGEELGVTGLAFLKEVDRINQARRDRVVELATHSLGDGMSGANIAVLGAAFKPRSDDIRDSPALEIAARLQQAGAHVTVTDPKALDAVRARHPELHAVDDVNEALRDADLVLVLTEWAEFRTLDPSQLNQVRRKVVIDGRNCLDPVLWREAGWEYTGLGR
ncbi:UDP-glucose/GDP-mannose dehydrogenase family protein [Arachnia propionica]|uniref:UDP-glucose 6-dehydrogenase n=1 Tax=Arachnia propionica TaxID=1750 RepID=A0A3P1WSP4_9ACTN|nr:UDP-glucose/GDP-mannose dehydrogenase family protein [Arachnia propionica]RRD49305.1 UDP-glucose/GDP-mannose dehydrogenase family protein [Arachnia propionica]